MTVENDSDFKLAIRILDQTFKQYRDKYITEDATSPEKTFILTVLNGIEDYKMGKPYTTKDIEVAIDSLELTINKNKDLLLSGTVTSIEKTFIWNVLNSIEEYRRNKKE